MSVAVFDPRAAQILADFKAGSMTELGDDQRMSRSEYRAKAHGFSA
ncbi:MAG: hypothetical protein JRE57_16565 [Deltaproteobacteria bacterium]|nr:hypothetical protein [Deltaproteobacteria bacterium]